MYMYMYMYVFMAVCVYVCVGGGDVMSPCLRTLQNDTNCTVYCYSHCARLLSTTLSLQSL